jgi:two-component system sensor histidine kinase UhpB
VSSAYAARSAPEPRDSLLLGIAFEAVWEKFADSDELTWTGNVESSFGYPRGEVEGHIGWWRERVHPDDLERVQSAAKAAVRGGATAWSNEYRFRRKDGSWAWVSSRGAIERDASGRARRTVGVMMDVTTLKDAELRLRLFTQQIPARATATDRDLRVLWDTGSAFASSPSAVGKSVPELFADSADRDRVLDGCRRALAGQASVLDIDDGTSAARLHLGPFQDPAGNVTGVVGVAFDITDRVRSEARLRETQRLLRQVLDTLPVGVAVLDTTGGITLDNPASRQIWGGSIVSGDERWVTTKGTWHDSGRPIAPGEWASRRALDEGEISRNELIDVETYVGGHRTIESYAAPIRDAQGAITGAVVVNEDVTERVRAAEALRKTERLLVEAERLGQTGGWEQDLLTGRITNTEANARLFFGDDHSKGERLDDYADVIHPDDRPRVIRSREKLLAGSGTGDIEYRIVRPDGSMRWIFGRATVVRDESGRAVRVHGTNADVTERKRAEDELARRARQLEMLSRKLIEAQETERRAIARELHDDFGQVLTALRLNLGRHDGRNSESLALVDGALARMRDLAQQLRPALLDERGLEASLRWYMEREAKRAGLEFRAALMPLEQRPPVTLEAAAFRIAQEAMTNVTRHAGARVVDVELGAQEGALNLAVRDDGRGFDVAAAHRRAANGESQGLINMQERAALAGGELQIDSAPGRGTTIRLRLPLRWQADAAQEGGA